MQKAKFFEVPMLHFTLFIFRLKEISLLSNESNKFFNQFTTDFRRLHYHR